MKELFTLFILMTSFSVIATDVQNVELIPEDKVEEDIVNIEEDKVVLYELTYYPDRKEAGCGITGGGQDMDHCLHQLKIVNDNKGKDVLATLTCAITEEDKLIEEMKEEVCQTLQESFQTESKIKIEKLVIY